MIVSIWALKNENNKSKEETNGENMRVKAWVVTREYNEDIERLEP
jgi:hypothetical protein